MSGPEPPTLTNTHASLWWTVASAAAAVAILALWWQANWSPSAPQAVGAPNPMALALHDAAGSDGDGWIALVIGLAGDVAVTPSTAAATLALLSPDGELILQSADARAATIAEDGVRDSLGLSADYIVNPVALSPEHRSVLVNIDSPLANVASSLAVLRLDTRLVTRLENCSATFLEMTDAGFLLMGDCGEASGMITLDYGTGEIAEKHAASVPEPWVWDEHGDRFVTIQGDYSECLPGGYLADGRLVATCESASAPGEYRAGAVEVGEDYAGEVALFDGVLVPVSADALAEGYLGFHAFAAGEMLVANQSTTEGDPLLEVLGNDKPGDVNIDSSSVALVAEQDGKVLVVNGTDSYGGTPRSGPALYWYDPATGESTFVSAVPADTTYVQMVAMER